MFDLMVRFGDPEYGNSTSKRAINAQAMITSARRNVISPFEGSADLQESSVRERRKEMFVSPGHHP